MWAMIMFWLRIFYCSSILALEMSWQNSGFLAEYSAPVIGPKSILFSELKEGLPSHKSHS